MITALDFVREDQFQKLWVVEFFLTGVRVCVKTPSPVSKFSHKAIVPCFNVALFFLFLLLIFL